MTKTRAIHQLTAGLTNGDAISNEAREYRETFRSWGYESAIFSEKKRILPELRHDAKDFSEAHRNISSDDIMLLHLSIGSPVNEEFKKLNCRKAIRYHNITPHCYFELINRTTAANLKKGREQIRSLKDSAEINLADSEFNAEELRQAGYSKVKVLPILLNIKDITSPPDRKVMKRFNDGTKNILFVGRCAPNKKIEDLLYAMACIRLSSGFDARLIHVGSFAGTERYYHLLLSLQRELGLERHAYFAGSVTQRQLSGFYQSASMFLCMSEHEGFCIPLLEAMAHRVPVIAYAAGAIPDTMDRAGIIFSEKNYPLIAETASELILNSRLRNAVLAGQHERMQRYLAREISNELKGHLAPLLAGQN